MEHSIEQAMTGELVELALRDLAAGNIEQLRDALTDLHPAQIAGLLEGMPPEQRRNTWELVSEENRGDVMAQVNDEVRATTPESEVAALFERRDLISVGVLDDEDHLLGRITVD